jgi:hypothetical protein
MPGSTRDQPHDGQPASPLLGRVKEIASEGHAKAAAGGADAALVGHRDAFDEKISARSFDRADGVSSQSGRLT